MTAKDPSGNVQPITISPQVQVGLSSGMQVAFGTGKFVEPKDGQSVEPQAIYGVWDPLTDESAVYNIDGSSASKFFVRTLVTNAGTTSLSGSSSFSYAISGSGTYRGWKINLSAARERIAVEGALGLGFVAFNSTIPEGECSGDGSGRQFCLDIYFGTSFCAITQVSEAGLLSRPNIVDVNNSDPDIEYGKAGSNDMYTKRNATGQRKLRIQQQLISTGTKIADGGNAIVAGTGSGAAKLELELVVGRMNWREIKNFND
jgi:Tfp pilus tip-associated adhesin PilY1